jgi:hypothetical protein
MPSTLVALSASEGFTAGDINTDGQVALTPAYQKVWVCDGTPANYWTLDFINTKCTGVASGAFSRGETMTQAVSGAAGVFDESRTNDHYIYRTTSTEFDTTNVITGATTSETVTPTAVQAPPHWKAWTTRLLASPADGTGLISNNTNFLPPSGSNLGALFSGRVFINIMQSPHQWIASRHRDPQDLQVAQADVGTPVSDQTANLGIVGGEIVAFIPYLSHYMHFGGADGIWTLRGDPGAGGQMTNTSRKVGVFGPDSWCFDNDGNLFFMSMDGFYVLPASSASVGNPPDNLTNTRVPNLIKSIGLNRRTDRVVMDYDKDRYGINVHISQNDSQYGVAFFWDLRMGSLDPDSFLTNQIAASMMYYDSRKAETRGLLMGDQDGYVRKFDDTAKNDDGDEAIEAFDTLGPFQAFNRMRRQGQITEIAARLGDDSDGATLDVYAGNAAETVVAAVKAASTPQATHTLSQGGFNPPVRPRSIGAAFAVKIGNSTLSERFSLERIIARINDAGSVKD